MRNNNNKQNNILKFTRKQKMRTAFTGNCPQWGQALKLVFGVRRPSSLVRCPSSVVRRPSCVAPFEC